jgi:cytochrome c
MLAATQGVFEREILVESSMLSNLFLLLLGMPAAPIASGTYTTAQAERGKIVYEQNCSMCHGPSLRGGANEFAAPALAGPFFFEKWSGRPLEELFRYSAENMPPGQPRLPDTAYLDVTAYILQVLRYPAGDTELSTDSPIMKRGIERQQ